MKRNQLQNRKRRRQDLRRIAVTSQHLAKNPYAGMPIQQLPPYYPSAYNPNPSQPTNTSFFSIQYSVDKIFPNDTPQSFHWNAPQRFGEYMRGFRYAMIKLVAYNLIRIPTFTGDRRPLFLYSDFGREQDNQFLAYLTQDTADNAFGNFTKSSTSIAGNIFVTRLYLNNDKTAIPTLASDGLEDVIYRFQVEFYNGF